MKKIIIVAAILLMTGCAALDTTSEILDVFYPDSVPICNEQSCGAIIDGQICVEYSDGYYHWVDYNE